MATIKYSLAEIAQVVREEYAVRLHNFSMMNAARKLGMTSQNIHYRLTGKVSSSKADVLKACGLAWPPPADAIPAVEKAPSPRFQSEDDPEEPRPKKPTCKGPSDPPEFDEPLPVPPLLDSDPETHLAYLERVGLGKTVRNLIIGRNGGAKALCDVATAIASLRRTLGKERGVSVESTGETVVYKDFIPDDGRGRSLENVISLEKKLAK